jgi:hypothetical protein
LVYRRKYFGTHPEEPHYKFDGSWFTLTDIKAVLKLPPKIIKDISRTKSAPHPNRRSNQEITLYHGSDSLTTALTFHGGYIGLSKASDNFKKSFNVYKEVNLYNAPRSISSDSIVNIFKKYGPLVNLIRKQGYITIVSYF